MPFADPPVVLPPQTALQLLAGIVRGLVTAVVGRVGETGLSFHMGQAINRKVIAAGLLVRDLAEALAAGTLKTRRSPVFAAGVKRKSPAPPPATTMAEGVVRLPRHFGWLLPLVPSAAATYGFQLRALLEHPDMMALLAASPRACRILRSLCWMLRTRLPPPFARVPPPRKPYVPPKVKVERPVKERSPRDRRPSSSRWPAWPPVPGSGSDSDGRLRHERPRPPGKVTMYSEEWWRERENRG